MSGGVDSSLAAARLLQQGYDVVGVTLHLWDYPDDGSVKSRCCAPEDIHDARRVADALGFPHYAFDRRELFQREVIEPFVDGYLTGEPGPLVTLSLYLHQTCHEQNSAIYSIGGTITFSSIFSGDPNEKNSQERLTQAEFVADFADPRQQVEEPDPEKISRIEGNFKFFFQRGQPAQPFQ